MLLGQYESTYNKKRRVAIPKQFRNELGDRIIFAKWYEGCVVAVSETNWNEIMKRITGEKTQMATSPVRDTDRFILGSAYMLEPDSQGRVVLPEKLSEYAKFQEMIVFLGLGERVELWDKEKWEERESYVSEHAAEFIEEIANKENGSKETGNKS